VLIANLMLQPADLLLLDEPTNDLDIPTLEILEESLLEYTGALVLVTHDRYMLDRISNVVLGLDGMGHAERFADYSQWDQWQAKQKQAAKAAAATATARSEPQGSRPMRSRTQEQCRQEEALLHGRARLRDDREQDCGRRRIAAEKQAVLELPEVVTDATRLQTALAEVEAAQNAVDALYARWASLRPSSMRRAETRCDEAAEDAASSAASHETNPGLTPVQATRSMSDANARQG
jgi:ATP-binding cassette subfamily F protein uup